MVDSGSFHRAGSAPRFWEVGTDSGTRVLPESKTDSCWRKAEFLPGSHRLRPFPPPTNFPRLRSRPAWSLGEPDPARCRPDLPSQNPLGHGIR